jgi:hypothetical protein
MEAIPLKEFLALVTQGVVSPRPVARRIIAARPSQGDRLAMVALGAAIQAMFGALAGMLQPDLAMGLTGHAFTFVAQFVVYAVVTARAIGVGGRFGGRGAPADVAAAVAWYAILSAALAPLQIAALAGGGVAVLLLGAGVNVWLMASCIAEAHGFERTGRVVGVVLGMFLLLAVTLSLLLGGLGVVAPA